MKILHTADWHIGQFKGPVVDGVNLRSQDTVKCLEYMVQVAIEEKPDIVCVSGDIFHQEQVGPVRYSDEMITATNIITSLAHFSKYVIVMRGTPNHDGAAQFRVLERMLLNIRNVDVVTEPGVIKTPWADIACLPGFDKQEFRAKFPGLSADEENLAWTKYISDMVFALRAECEKTPILMAHYTVPGCNMESGQTSFFTNFEPVIPREALMAARYEAVLLGHIHRPQIIEGLDNVFYSGAINAISVNDPACGAGATLVAAANIFHRKKINYQTRVLFTANDIDRVVAQMCYIQLSLLGCAGWVAVANTISNPVCGDPLMPVEKPGQEFWYTPFYFRGEWNCRRQIQIFKEMCGSWITPIEERNPGKITFYFDFEKGDYKCQNS